MKNRFTIPVAVVAVVFAILGGCKQKESTMSDLGEYSAELAGDTVPVDPAVTRKLFLKWRAPRHGTSNPERMNNPLWEWLVKTRISAYQATQLLKGPPAMESGPGWCFDRFGQSSNRLADGRIVFVAGEHEDHYDPDFYIYNDVVVQHPDGRIDIFGYPRDVFPPTDFHSATLIGNRLALIGSLGYPKERRPGETPVMLLDLETMAIATVKTSGTPPGWIHGHMATLASDGASILIQRGKLQRGDSDARLVENIDDWRLRLDGWQWERLTQRRWPRWECRRADGEMNHLFDYQRAVWAKEMPELAEAGSDLARLKEELGLPSLTEELGGALDLELFARRFKPPLPFEEVPRPDSDEEYNVHRIKVAGVVVRYVEETTGVQMTVEGELPEETLSILTRDLVEKLSKLENSPCKIIRL